ncbi:MAG: hypothetical protein AVDCRST_MAG04-3068, partial [uncultured Acetobacteraceae bacterium]
EGSGLQQPRPAHGRGDGSGSVPLRRRRAGSGRNRRPAGLLFADRRGRPPQHPRGIRRRRVRRGAARRGGLPARRHPRARPPRPLGGRVRHLPARVDRRAGAGRGAAAAPPHPRQPGGDRPGRPPGDVQHRFRRVGRPGVRRRVPHRPRPASAPRGAVRGRRPRDRGRL